MPKKVIPLNTKDFVINAKLTIAESDDIEALKDLQSRIERFRSDAEEVWEDADQINIRSLMNKSKEFKPLVDTDSLFELSLESSALYIPAMRVLGPLDARKNLSSWMSELMGLQTKLSGRINSLSLKQESSVTETEVSNGGAASRVMFFISNDADIHGSRYLETARTTDDIVGCLKAMKELDSFLWGFRTDESSIHYGKASKSAVKIGNLAKWSMVIKSCITILESRAKNPIVPEED